MKHLYLVLLFFVFSSLGSYSYETISIDGKSYRIEMIEHKHNVGSGISFYSYRLPEYPLEVAIMEIDVRNPYVKFEACLSRDSTLNTETVRSMVNRNSYAGHEVIGAINGDFYTMSGPSAGTTCNGSMCLGQIGVVPNDFGPVLAFDLNNLPYIDDMRFTGKVLHNGQEVTIDGVNTTRGEDKLILYNHLHGKTTKTNEWGAEVILRLKEGYQFTANAELVCEVVEVVKDRGNSPLTKEQFVLSGHQTKAEFLRDFNVGEEIIVYQEISLLDYPEVLPQLTDLIGSNCTFLKDGEVVNITTTDGAPGSANPRTAAGFSADKSKMYFCVVDGRTTLSAGLKTTQLADIFLHAGASTAINFDGGGSSILLVRGEAGNKPLENRSVANAFLAVSTAPEDKTVDYIEMNFSEGLDITYGNSVQLSISTFNQYGNVIDYKRTTQGITYKVIGDIGTIDEKGVFLASGNDKTGYIEATYGELTDRITVNMTPIKQIGFTLKSFIIDHIKDYTLIVQAIDEEDILLTLDNQVLTFKSADENIVKVDEYGVVKGLQDGTTEITVTTLDGLYEDVCQIKVEIGEGNIVLDDFTNGWVISATDLVNRAVLERRIPKGYTEEMLAVDYSMVYENTKAFIEIQKAIPVYGIPSALEVNMISNGKLATVGLYFDHSNGLIMFEKFTEEVLNSYKGEVEFDKFQQQDFPLIFNKIRLTIEKDNNEYTKGETYSGTFYLKDLRVIYPDNPNNIEIEYIKTEDSFYGLYPNPSRGFIYLNSLESDIDLINIYTIQGALAASFKGNMHEINISNLSDGIYLCEILTTDSKRYLNKISLNK